MKYNNDNHQKILLSVLALCHIVCSNGLMSDCAEVEYHSKLFTIVFFTCFMSILKDAVLDLKFKIPHAFFHLTGRNKRVIDCKGLRWLDMRLISLCIKLILQEY